MLQEFFPTETAIVIISSIVLLLSFKYSFIAIFSSTNALFLVLMYCLWYNFICIVSSTNVLFLAQFY